MFYKEIDNINKTVTKKAKEEAKSKLVKGMLQDPGFNRKQKLKLLDELIFFTTTNNPEYKHKLQQNKVIEAVQMFITKLKQAVARTRRVEQHARSPAKKPSRVGFNSGTPSEMGPSDSPLIGGLKLEAGYLGLRRRRTAKGSNVSTTVIIPRRIEDDESEAPVPAKMGYKSRCFFYCKNPNRTCIFQLWSLRTTASLLLV